MHTENNRPACSVRTNTCVHEHSPGRHAATSTHRITGLTAAAAAAATTTTATAATDALLRLDDGLYRVN